MPEYIPKFKLGQTIRYTDNCNRAAEDTVDYIIIATFRGMKEFSPYYTQISSAYNDSDTHHTMYATWNCLLTCCMWRWEENLELYCSNTNRGKKILLEPVALCHFTRYHGIRDVGLETFMKQLNNNQSHE